MKFKKDGMVFEDIAVAGDAFCREQELCSSACPLREAYEADSYPWCIEFENAHPAEAARLMGYEVVEEESCDTCAYNPPSAGDGKPCSMCDTSDPMLNCYQKKEANMDKQSTTSQEKIPCVSTGAGVGPGNQSSKPRICEVLGVEVGERFCISRMGEKVVFWIVEDGTYRTEPPSALKSSYAILQAIEHPEYVIRPPRFTEEEVADARAIVRLFNGFQCGVVRKERGGLLLEDKYGDALLAISGELFPSILPGQSVKLSDIVGGGT